MKILMLHNRYLVRGGEDEATDLETEMLRQHGHDVDLLTFDNRMIAGRGLFAVGLEAVWSPKAFRLVRERIWQGGHDLVHVQNPFPLISPSAYYAAKACGKPVVQTLHNYRLVCLNALLYRNGVSCEDCLGKAIPWPGVLHGCYRQSRAGSLTVALMLVFHRLLRTWQRKVDVYCALSEFAKEKIISGGIPAGKIAVRSNLVYPDPGVSAQEKRHVLFAGRLVPEKGIALVLEVWKKRRIRIPLLFAGDGPMESVIRRVTDQMPWVQCIGRRSQSEVCELMGSAHFVILPTLLYETFNRNVVEAYAKGTPILASRIGSIMELVKDRETGLLFDPGREEDLTAKVEWALAHPREMARMGKQARKEYEAKYSEEINYQQLLRIYESAIDNNSAAHTS